jgi:hypothetical protein
MLIGPAIHRLGDEFAAIVGLDRPGLGAHS